MRSTALSLTLAASVSFIVPVRLAHAQATWPAQRVNMYIGFAAGGFADSVARVIGAALEKRLGQSFVAQNMEGGGSVRATRQTAVSPPDGYTLLVTTTAMAINEHLVLNRGYAASQLTPVAIPVSAPEGMTANKDAPIKNVADLVAMAKAGKVYLGTPGIGSGSHIAAEYFFRKLVGVTVRDIPFQGGSPAMLALMAGDINVLASTATGTTSLRAIADGDVTGLALASATRARLAPNTPTFAEAGFPGYEASSWVGFFAPAATPVAIVDRLNGAINDVLKDDDVRKRIDLLGLDILTRDRAATAAFFNAEIGNWSKMVDAAGLTPQ